jgi:hypothetical protein
LTAAAKARIKDAETLINFITVRGFALRQAATPWAPPTAEQIGLIHVRRLVSGAEMAGIKFHGAMDVQITHNHIDRTCLGLWLDWISMKHDPAWSTEQKRKMVTTKLLGRAVIPNETFEQPDGSRIRVNTDDLGRSRNKSNPTPGPFENPGQEEIKLKVW